MQGEVDEGRANFANLMYSIGIIVNEEGTILDVNPDLPAAKAGLAPGMTVKKVNDTDFTLENLNTAVAATKSDKSSIKIEAQNSTTMGTFNISYKGGARYPHLVRDTSKTDYLSGITKPLSNGSVSNIPPGFVPGEPQAGIFSLAGRPRPKIMGNLPPPLANVNSLLLSQKEIKINCPANSNICSNNQKIEISIEASSNDPTDVLTYNYTITGGKIVGTGAKVIWDLSGVIPGTYTITAGVDNGCGVCGTTKTEQVKVIDASITNN